MTPSAEGGTDPATRPADETDGTTGDRRIGPVYGL